MEKTLSMGAFEALDQQELSRIDGGTGILDFCRFNILYSLYRVAKDLYDLGYSNGYNSVIYGG